MAKRTGQSASHGDRFKIQPLRLYAFVELLIGISAIAVPYELTLGRHLLEHWQLSSSWAYYLASGFWVALSLDSMVRLHGRHLSLW